MACNNCCITCKKCCTRCGNKSYGGGIDVQIRGERIQTVSSRHKWRSLHGVVLFCIVLQYVAVCCSVLQCVAVCCSVLQCGAMNRSTLQCTVVHCSVLQSVAVWDQGTVFLINANAVRSPMVICSGRRYLCVCVTNVCVRKKQLRDDYMTPNEQHAHAQHIVTQCNTLQHTAAHFNALQDTATHCNALQHTARHCNTLQHVATHHTATHHFIPSTRTATSLTHKRGTKQEIGDRFIVHPDKSQFGMLQRAATRCTVLQYSVCCIVLQLLAVCCSGLVIIWSDVHHQDFVIKSQRQVCV